jgi:hypothetical protein
MEKLYLNNDITTTGIMRSNSKQSATLRSRFQRTGVPFT